MPSPLSQFDTSLVVVILAGGSSARMGTDKALLIWNGVPLLQHQIDLARSLGAVAVWISGRESSSYDAFACPVLHDPVKGAGPLAGLVAGLRAACDSYDWMLALAVDLPCMTREYLTLLTHEAMASKLGVLPRRGPYFEPLAAVYPVTPALKLAEAHLASGRFALQDLAVNLIAQNVAVARPISPAELPLFANWNNHEGPRIAGT